MAQEYGGDASRIWTQARDGADLVRRLEALPGFGAAKAKIFGALVGKQLGIQPAGWEEATTPYGEPGAYRSVADVVDAESLLKVRAFKQQAKQAAKAAAAEAARAASATPAKTPPAKAQPKTSRRRKSDT